jgi:hypothetical protein
MSLISTGSISLDSTVPLNWVNFLWDPGWKNSDMGYEIRDKHSGSATTDLRNGGREEWNSVRVEERKG